MTPNSDHFDGERFFNPTGPAVKPFSAVPRLMLERRTKWPSRIDVPTRQPQHRDNAYERR